MATLEDEFMAAPDLEVEFAAKPDLEADFASYDPAASAPAPLKPENYQQWVLQRQERGQQEPISVGETIPLKFFDGYLKGGLDEGVGKATALIGRGKAFLAGKDFTDADAAMYETGGTDLVRRKLRGATEQHPVVSGIAGQAGDLVTDAAAGVITKGKSFTPAGQGALGALEGALRADGSAGDRAAGAALGGTVSALGAKYLPMLGPVGAPAAGLAVGEGFGRLAGETEGEALERRTRAGTSLGAGAVGSLRKKFGDLFGARRDRAVGQIQEKITDDTLEATDAAAKQNAKAFEAAEKDYVKSEAFRNKEVADQNASLFKAADEEVALQGKKELARAKDSEKYYKELLADELNAKKQSAMSALHGHGEQPVDPKAAAIGRLGAYVQEGYRFPRNEGDLKSRGFALDEDAEKGLQEIIPDYNAKANEHLGKLGRLGKKGLLEEFEAEELAKAAAKAEHDAKVAEVRQTKTDDLPAEFKHWAAERAGYDPALLKPDSPEDLVSPDFKASVLEKYRQQAQPLPVKPNDREIPQVPHLPLKPGVLEKGGEFRPTTVAEEVELGGERAKIAAAHRASYGKMGAALSTLGGLATFGVLPAVGLYRGAADRARLDPNTREYRDPGAAAWWNGKLQRVLGGNPELRQKLTTFLAVDNADPAALELRLQWALDNVPGFREAWEADQE